ncbi:hypothetical protein Bhyg_15504 [Pseudolycoriella hygida]|uniref:Uncharacterized protein n=1 Tax=Pseudolycoriella hygida TaxID=35572 RepID=A0A9Q0MM71_9DIPT|nr:hypothetical protein Bhyg_15504 [Pseudolycoriella hygida]
MRHIKNYKYSSNKQQIICSLKMVNESKKIDFVTILDYFTDSAISREFSEFRGGDIAFKSPGVELGVKNCQENNFPFL